MRETIGHGGRVSFQRGGAAMLAALAGLVLAAAVWATLSLSGLLPSPAHAAETSPPAGQAWAWGDNLYGELGDGTNTDRTTPVRVSGLAGVVDVEAGNGHSLAIGSGSQGGRIVVEKQVEPDGTPGRFAFKIDGQPAGVIRDNQTIELPVKPGAHAISEDATPGWALSGLVCQDPDATMSLTARTANVVVGDGETVRCAFIGRQTTGVPQLVRTYAPEVRFHPEEKHWPMDPGAFVAASKLKWAADAGCLDKTIVGTEGAVSASKLAAGGYRSQAVSDVVCMSSGDYYDSAQPTAPAKSSKPWHLPSGQKEGFFLDLRDTARSGKVPIDAAYSNAPALYYEFVPRQAIVYWFHYGHNDRVGDTHEGDWERVVVRLDAGNRPSEFAYYQHNCDPEEDNDAMFSWADMAARGYLTGGTTAASRTHPIVYSAKGGHPSFPTAQTTYVPCGTGGFYDRTANGGKTWKSWVKTDGLRNASLQPWYGYGGGWGSKDASAIGWGPMGPGLPQWRNEPPIPSSWR